MDGETVIDYTLDPYPVSVSTSLDRATNELIVKLVNPHDTPVSARIALSGVPGLGRVGRLVTLTGERHESNSFERPDAVTPHAREIEISPVFTHPIPPVSLQILRVPLVSKKQ